MLLTLIANGKIHTSSLPEEAGGMRWIAESDAHGARRYGFAEAKDGVWVLSPKKGMQLADEYGALLERAALDPETEQVFQLGDAHGTAALVVRPTCAGDRTYSILGFASDEVIGIGSAPDNALCYGSRFVSGHHARIDYARDEFSLTDLGSSNGTFVNGVQIKPQVRVALAPGDVVEVLGLVIAVGHRFVSFNNPTDALVVKPTPNFVWFEQPSYQPPTRDTHDQEEPAFFYPAPRFKRDVERRAFSVDAPPAPEKPDDTPVAMKIGPSMVMGLAAVFSGAVMFMRMQESGGSLLMAAPMLVMAVSLVLGSVLWPILAKRFEKKKATKAEARRRQTYAAYLDKIRTMVRDETAHQKEVLEENRIPVAECMRRAFELDPRLMDRTPAHDDFLELRLGTGTVPLAADIRYPDEHFTVETDDLSEVVYQLSREPKDIVGAPVAVSLAANPVVGLAGPAADVRELAFGLVAQLACLHSYEDVKLAVLADEGEADAWAWACALPHAFTDDTSMRFCATTLEEASEIGLALGRIAEERREASGRAAAAPLPQYVVVCASRHLAGKSELVEGLARTPAPGFTVVCLAEERKDLPKQCTCIVEASRASGTLRDRDDASGKGLAFSPDAFTNEVACRELSRALNTVQLDVTSAKEALPEGLGFLEMFEAGNLEQLNVRARWKAARASETLAARVGMDAAGEPFMLNLHERFHGPHGLIAGTTGSGKSEFIITWILSMCCEYSPEEVAFVLIDYKGGGLAGAFDNDRTRLPHLAGTVTNLDGAAIARSLASVQSELKRRQALLNAARPAAGGDNVDIYKYQDLYRAGKVGEPCPHLFLVADEFAELKAQEPEFMDELISAARIGRSLGVHLVLATQKPTGVVNDQIWSNSKFKVCLKVADAADSKEMIKRPDAAELVQAGRFYLLVGYNEQFSLGQAAWAGTPYVPVEQYSPASDDSVVLVGPTGRALAQARPAAPAGSTRPAPQLVAVLAHLAEVACEENLSARRLWLDPLPAVVAADALRARRATERAELHLDNPTPFELDPVVGLLDDPANQSQRVLTLPLTSEGNAVLYGSADSGAESLLSAMLYDLVSTHDAAHLNAYVMDFGSEALGAFRGAPQVGEVVVAGEDEKVSRLFDMLEHEVAERRRLFATYGGSLAGYSRQASDKPALLLVVNGVAVFNELYERYEQRLIALARDGLRVGLSVLLCATSTVEVRMRLRSCMKLSLACGLADNNEYLNVLGTMRGVVPPQGRSRGLVRIGETVYVFQGAQVVGPDGDEFGFVTAVCTAMAVSSEAAAPGVPVLPDVVTPQVLEQFAHGSRQLPVGISEDNLSCVCLDFEDHVINRVLFSKAKDGTAFVRELAGYAARQKKYDLALVDAAKLLADLPGICALETQDDGQAMALFDELLYAKQDPPEKPRLVLISGIAGLLMRADPMKTNIARLYLRHLRSGEGAIFVLFDMPGDATYSQEDWFKSQLGPKDGLWVGEGLDSQTAIQITYGIGERIDPTVKGARGYVVEGGKIRKVKLLSDGKKG